MNEHIPPLMPGHSGDSSISALVPIPLAEGQEGDNWSSVESEHENSQVPVPAEPVTPTWGQASGNQLRRKRGRPKKLSRQPFIEASHRYLSEIVGLKATTKDGIHKRYQVIGHDLWKLRKAEAGKPRVATTNPVDMSEDDIRVLAYYWEQRGLSSGYRRKLLTDLEAILAWSDNGALTKMRKSRTFRMPKAVDKAIMLPSPEQRELIRRAAESIEGWNGSVARFIVNVYPATGLRFNELRTAKVTDIEQSLKQMVVSNPKGNGSWAGADMAPILPSARQAFEDYLAERKAYLNGAETDILIPLVHWDGRIAEFSMTHYRRIKWMVQERSGVQFKIKDFRAIFIQDCIDRGIELQAVSKAARHATTKTTELFYGRIRTCQAFNAIDRAFSNPLVEAQK